MNEVQLVSSLNINQSAKIRPVLPIHISVMIFTVLFLEDCLQFGHFAEVHPPPLLVLGHHHVWFPYRTTETSAQWNLTATSCREQRSLGASAPLCGMLTGMISLASTPDSCAALLRL